MVERIDHDLLFRWFVGLGIEDPVWDATTFTKNRDRLLEGDVAAQFLAAVLTQDKVKALLLSEHFTVDGTLLEAWASLKSFRPKDGSGEPPGPGRNGERDFHGEPRRNDTHVSTTDPDARLFRKGPGKEAVVLHGPRADGEPQRSDYRRADHNRVWPCRAASGAGADRAPRRDPAAGHARCRQETLWGERRGQGTIVAVTTDGVPHATVE